MPPKPQPKKTSTSTKTKSTIKARVPSIQRTVVPAAVGETIRPHSSFSAGPSQYPGSLIFRGMDLISPIQLTNQVGTPTTFPIATSLFNMEISPTGPILEGSRVYKIGGTFERYLFRKMRFHYQSMTSTATNGGVVLAYETDPLDGTPPANIHGFQSYTALRDSVQMNVWQHGSLDCRISAPSEALFTSPNGPDERLFFQGQVYVATASVVTVPATTTLTLGNLWFEYEVLFYDPTIEANLSLTAAVGPRPLAFTSTGWQNYNVLANQTVGTDPGLSAEVLDSSGKFTIDGLSGKLMIQNAGDFIANVSGLLNLASTDSAAVTDSIITRIAAGAGVNVSSAYTSIGSNASVVAGGSSLTGFGNLFQIFVDPFSAAIDRWIQPEFVLNMGGSSTISRTLQSLLFSLVRPPVAPKAVLPTVSVSPPMEQSVVSNSPLSRRSSKEDDERFKEWLKLRS